MIWPESQAILAALAEVSPDVALRVVYRPHDSVRAGVYTGTLAAYGLRKGEATFTIRTAQGPKSFRALAGDVLAIGQVS